MKASGSFNVNLQPLDPHAPGGDGMNIGRMSIEKTFLGDLEGKSLGEMLSVRTPVQGSAGYVAIEQVSATISGRVGTFVLQHFGIMAGNNHRLVLEVVPDSGTGELEKISGTMSIEIEDGKHSYVFDYALQE